MMPLNVIKTTYYMAKLTLSSVEKATLRPFWRSAEIPPRGDACLATDRVPWSAWGEWV